MAKASRAVSVGSDSSAEVERGVARQTSSSKKRKSSSGKAKNATPPSPAATDDDQAAEEEEQAGAEGEDEEVYEIERIIKAEMGHFQPGVHGYFVHWKGYPASEDSWVNEPDAEGAMDLINEYWKKHKKSIVTKSRKSGGGGQNLPEITPGRKSASSAVESEELGPTSKSSRAPKSTKAATPKALRSSAPAKRPRVSDVSDKMDVDDVEPQPENEEEEEAVLPPSKRKAPNNGKNQSRAKATPTTKTKSKATRLEDSEITGDSSMHSTQMSHKYEHLDSWEDIVAQISTVERDSDNNLQIYWVSTTKEDCLTPAETFKHKAPLLLINFYESNLRWRPNST